MQDEAGHAADPAPGAAPAASTVDRFALARDVSRHRRLEHDHEVSLFFFECMDRLSRVIQASADLAALTRGVTDLVREVFDADRSWLLHPGDAPTTWDCRAQAVRGAGPDDPPPTPAPICPELAEGLRPVLDADGPVAFGAGNERPVPEPGCPGAAVRSAMAMVLRPRVGPRWLLGVQESGEDRVWTVPERQLLQEIGRRLCDGLSSLLTLRDLQESERRYRRIVDTANEGIWAVDADDLTTFVNHRLCELLGYPAEEIIGRSTHEFTFPDDLADVTTHLDARRSGRSERYERRFRHRDGHPVWTILSLTSSVDEQQRYLGAFAMVTDITEQKLAEERVQRLNEGLEQRVRDRTRELETANQERDLAFRELQTAHARVLQQEKMASIGQLAAGIAHEINTPTQFVGDNLAFLKDAYPQLLTLVADDARAAPEAAPDALPDGSEPADLEFLAEEIPRALEESVTGVQRIARIVGALKDFAHRSGSQPEPVDLPRLIRSTVEMTRHEWKHVAQVRLDLDPNLEFVTGRRDELGQVLLNLLVNASHAIADTGATPQSGQITVSTRERDGWVELWVRDNGCGIPAEVQSRIFEPFFTTKGVGRGSGQGLAIVYDIVVVNHGGQVVVESEAGAGATFVVRIPADPDDG